jgi:acetyltransferase-like isoleucine patch superfamily enzyme
VSRVQGREQGRVQAGVQGRFTGAARFLRGPIERLIEPIIEQRVTEALNRYTYGIDDNPLYRYQVHGRLERLHIHPTAIVNNALFNVSGGDITVGKDAFFGHNVAVLTGTHDITKFGRERQTTFPQSGRDVVIGEGVWVASHAVVLAPVTIGEHAVVAAGSLVTGDVPPYAIVAGRPARVVRVIDPEAVGE